MYALAMIFVALAVLVVLLRLGLRIGQGDDGVGGGCWPCCWA